MGSGGVTDSMLSNSIQLVWPKELRPLGEGENLPEDNINTVNFGLLDPTKGGLYGPWR